MVLKLGLESHPRREVTLALIDDMTDMGGEVQSGADAR